ncbi:putative caffeoyl-CoA O-methyltransferase 1-like protein [Cladobotryum mycophilum]|uniref:Caffeoyl-CoA O-methyltransferase 1-like protein n=1 Tax=Cladobotryum mycophilum TaxID=491253 RepID=A0ABR0S4Y1_9HYPO
MKGVDSSYLYATPELGEKVSEYASQHSTVVPKFITDYHQSVSSHEDSIMLSSDFQSQLHLFLANTVGAKRVSTYIRQLMLTGSFFTLACIGGTARANMGVTMSTVLEVGVYLGYSCMVWSHAVGPDGHVTGLEFVPEFAKLSEEAFAKHGINNVEILVGPAAETLPKLQPSEPYDLVFMDADKPNYSTYLTLMLETSKPGSPNRLLRPGALIIADNVLRAGRVVDSTLPYDPALGAKERFDGQVKALKVFNEQVKSEPRLQSVMLPLWDGVTVMRLLD